MKFGNEKDLNEACAEILNHTWRKLEVRTANIESMNGQIEKLHRIDISSCLSFDGQPQRKVLGVSKPPKKGSEVLLTAKEALSGVLGVPKQSKRDSRDL